MDKYATTLECFLTMLLQPQGGYATPYGPNLEQAVENLKTAVETGVEDLIDLIDIVLTAVWQTSWRQSMDHKVPDPTERFVMLKSLRMDGSWMDPVNITPLLAKFKFLIRTALLRSINREDDQDEAYILTERWCKEGVASTFDTISDLQHRASAIVATTQAPVNLIWTDNTTLRYRGDEITLEALQKMFVQMEQDAKSLWEDDILMGSGLHVDHEYIKEDLDNRKPGYCFLDDDRNSFSKYRLTLLQHIVQSPTLGPRFFHVEGGRLVWHKTALLKWLKDYSRLNALHLTRLEMLSGGPGRGTELTAMQYRSTQTRGLRNFVSIGGHCVLLRTYGKTSSRSGTDRLIPHSVDGYEGPLLTQDLILARPFAEFVVSQCLPNKPDLLRAYQYQLFVNFDKSFDTKDLSKEMIEYTSPYLLAKIGVHEWRHLVVAIRRKHCPTQIDIYGDEDENTVEDHIGAEQTGHSVRTERLRYAITAEALAGPSEDVLPLFFQASNNWQQLMRAVPGTSLQFKFQCPETHVCLGGLGLTYAEAQSKNFDTLIEANIIKQYQTKRTVTSTPSPPSAHVDIDLVVERVTAALVPKLQDMMQSMTNSIVAQLKPVLPVEQMLNHEDSTMVSFHAFTVAAKP